MAVVPVLKLIWTSLLNTGARRGEVRCAANASVVRAVEGQYSGDNSSIATHSDEQFAAS